MTATQRKTLTTFVAAPLAVMLLAWGFRQYDESKIDTSRFLADSIARSAQSATDHATLERIDRRVGQIYCGSLPADKRAGCQ